MLHYPSSENLLLNSTVSNVDCSFSKYERDCDTTASSSGDLNDKPVLVKNALCSEFQRSGSCS
jgi:hypothetical protein